MLPNTLNALTQLPQVPLDMTLEGLKATGQSQQADQIGLQELMRKQQFETQMDPLRVQQQQNDVNIGLQDLYGKTRANKEADFTSNARMQSELKKHLAAATDSDVHMAYNKFRMMAASENPHERALGVAGLQTTDEFIKNAATLRSHEKVAGMNNNTQIKLEQMRIDAGKYDKVNRFAVGFESELAKAQGAAKKLAVVQQYKALAKTDPDLASKMEVLDILEMRLAPQAAAELAASQQKPGQVDVQGLTNGQVPTTPSLPIVPAKPGSKENPIVLK